MGQKRFWSLYLFWVWWVVYLLQPLKKGPTLRNFSLSLDTAWPFSWSLWLFKNRLPVWGAERVRGKDVHAWGWSSIGKIDFATCKLTVCSLIAYFLCSLFETLPLPSENADDSEGEVLETCKWNDSFWHTVLCPVISEMETSVTLECVHLCHNGCAPDERRGQISPAISTVIKI